MRPIPLMEIIDLGCCGDRIAMPPSSDILRKDISEHRHQSSKASKRSYSSETLSDDRILETLATEVL